MRVSRFRSALLVHGAGGGGWEWNLWRDVFASSGMQVIAPDLQPVADGLPATRFDDYQRQVRTALEALPRPRAVVGASLGGLLAMRVAEAADALVLANPLPSAPWHVDLPLRAWPGIVPWRRDARLSSTRRALPESDDATALFAFRHWRDESGAVLRDAYAGLAVERPACPVLFMLSRQDEDIPAAIPRAMAAAWAADVLETPSGSHVGPLLGRHAASIAAQAVAWLNTSGQAG